VSSEKINRLLSLIMILHSGQAGSPEQLTASLGVTRRTLFRDLSILKKAGISHQYEPGKGYRLERGYFLPAINLDVIETLGLLILGKTAAAQRNRPMMTAALSAINKLILAIPEPLRVACSDVMANISVNPGSQNQVGREDDHYRFLQACIDQNQSCDMTYGSPQAPEPMKLRLDPYALHFASRAWYVFGKSDVHKAIRVFKLSRIQTLTETKRFFRRPARFSAEKFMGKAWQMIPEGKVQRIELEFSPMVATNVAEVLWHPTQKTRRLADGRCVVTFDVAGLREITWWICGYADQVKVIKPKELAQTVRAMHQRAAEK